MAHEVRFLSADFFFNGRVRRRATGAATKQESPAQIAARQAFEAAKTAAEAGDPVKLRELADLYYAGKGVTKNLGEAYKQYLASAEKGDVLSEATVGWMLRNGQGVTRDYKKCLEWYTRPDKGHVESQLGVAELYYNSVGLPKRDYATAYQWYLIASGLGSKEAAAFIPRMEQAVLKDPTSMPSKGRSRKSGAGLVGGLREEIASRHPHQIHRIFGCSRV